MEAKVYDASPAGVTDATTEAQRAHLLGFLPPSLPPPVTPRRIHLRNNTWYTVSRSPAYPGYAIHYTVRRNNVTLAPLVADHCSSSSFISPLCIRGNIDLWIRGSPTNDDEGGEALVLTLAVRTIDENYSRNYWLFRYDIPLSAPASIDIVSFKAFAYFRREDPPSYPA